MCPGSKECVLTMCSVNCSKERVLTMCSGSKECVLTMCPGSKECVLVVKSVVFSYYRMCSRPRTLSLSASDSGEEILLFE